MSRPDPATTRPARPIPFYAKAAGEVPREGKPVVAGLELPAGSPRPDVEPFTYWCSHEPVTHPERLAGALATAFPQTGLWPVLWDSPEGPANHMPGHADLARLGAIDAGRALGVVWDDWFEQPFAGLAEPTVAMDAPPPPHDPFAEVGTFSAIRHAEELWLLLVPCNRPADVLAVLGWSYSEMPHELTAAVLRSWEERFAVVPVRLDPVSVVLHVGAPPTSASQARALVAEIAAMSEYPLLGEESLDDAAQLLLKPPPPSQFDPALTNTLWQLTFRQQSPAKLTTHWWDGQPIPPAS